MQLTQRVKIKSMKGENLMNFFEKVQAFPGFALLYVLRVILSPAYFVFAAPFVAAFAGTDKVMDYFDFDLGANIY